MKKSLYKLLTCIISLIIIFSMTVSVFAEGEDNYLDDYELKEVDTVYKTGEKLAVSVVENGAVLLRNEKNENGETALPLASGEKVNVFGWAGTNDGFILQGTGSGTGTKKDVVTFLSALEKEGVNALPTENSDGGTPYTHYITVFSGSQGESVLSL